MSEFADHDKFVQSIYKKTEVKKQQKPEQPFLLQVPRRMNVMLLTMEVAISNPKTPRKDIDEMARGISQTFDTILMHSDPFVIEQLINKAIMDKVKENYMRKLQ